MSTSPTDLHLAPEPEEHSAALPNVQPQALAPESSNLPAELRRVPSEHAAMEQADGRHLTDEQVLQAYCRGDRAAFAKLVARYQRELFHFLIRFVGDRSAAEDVFQETFLQVHQSAAQFDPARRFRPWIFTIAANKARDLLRCQARRPANPLQAAISPGNDDSAQYIDLIESMAEQPGENLEKKEMERLVRHTVLHLPDHLREILLLSYFHQFPYKQISAILKIPLGTVKSRLHAAVAHFADRWQAIQQNKPSGRRV